MATLKPSSFEVLRKGFAYLLGERVLRIFIGVFVHVLVVRSLGPELYGVYGLAMSYFVIVQPFVNYGADDLILKDVIKEPMNSTKYLSSLWVYKIIWALISYIGLIAFVFFREFESSFIFLVAILGTYNLANTLSIFELKLQSQSLFKEISVSRFSSYIIFSIAKIIMIFSFLDIYWLAVFYVLEILIARLFMLPKTSNTVSLSSIDFSYMKSFFKRSWPYLVTVFVLVLSQRVGVFILNNFRSLEEVGNYNVLLSLLKFFDFFPLVLFTTFMPNILAIKESNLDKYRRRISGIYFILILICFGLSSITFIFSDLIVKILYGEKYIYLAQVLAPGFLGLTFTFLNLFKARHFLIEDMYRSWMMYNLTILALVIPVLYALVPVYGIIGAIYAYMLACLGADLIFLIFVKGYRKIMWRIMGAIKTPYYLLRDKTL